jgi:hypothetical protein
MARRDALKQHVLAALDTLPEEALEEVAAFLESQRGKRTGRPPDEPPYHPVALGGLWDGQKIRDEDIDDVRREMWRRFTNREP